MTNAKWLPGPSVSPGGEGASAEARARFSNRDLLEGVGLPIAAVRDLVLERLERNLVALRQLFSVMLALTK